MDLKEAKKRIEILKREIEKYRYAYHVLNQSLISDEALDSLKKELYDLEQKFPQLITPDSPTQRVSGKPLKFFQKVAHKTPMISLNDAFSEDDMKDWYERIKKLISADEKLDFYCEYKFDGLAISLEYEKGIFKVGSTRGDGKIGEDVTQNLKTIEAIPLRLKKDINIEVRGEVLLTKEEFKRINEEQIKKGLPVYANPRNVAAGSIRQLDPKVTASRKLDFYAYDLIGDFELKTHEEKHQFLKELGLKVHFGNKKAENLEEIFAFHKKISKEREKLPFEIDGIVVIVNSNQLFEKLGVVGKAPRGAIAYKFSPRETTTIIEDIKVQVGRTGVLTPVAILKPVDVGGVTISRATLHNKEEIKRLGLKIKDTVIISRAGDVIPKIEKVLKNLRIGEEKEFKMPSRCPVCGSKVVEDEGGIILRCPNKNCPARQLEHFYHFVSKGAFDIKGVGPKIINRLIDEGLIQEIPDIFDLKEGDIAPLERYGEKSSKNIIRAIQSSKNITLNRFIYALGIPHIGEENAILLAEYFQEKIRQLAGKNKEIRISDLIKIGRSLKEEELNKVKTIGPKIAFSIVSWFKEKRSIEFLKKLEAKGINIIPVISRKEKGKLKGLTFVLTGTLLSMSRSEAKRRIREEGGEVSETVSRKTDYVVVGENPGSKLKKALELKIKTLNEQEFLKII